MAKDRRAAGNEATRQPGNGLAPPPGRNSERRQDDKAARQPGNEAARQQGNEATAPTARPRELTTDFLLRVPVVPPIEYGLHGENNTDCARIEVRLEIAESRVLRRIQEGLQLKVTRLRSGRIISTYPDVIRWLLEQAVEEARRTAVKDRG